MPDLIGPDFVGIKNEDLDAARVFYAGGGGLWVAAHSRPDAVVFDTSPVPFAVRTPITDKKNKDALGEGIAIWSGCDYADALHEHLIGHRTHIVFAPEDKPFGRYSAFRDPFGYTTTPHTAGRS